MSGIRRGIVALSALALVVLGMVPASAAPPGGWAGETIVGAGNTWEPHIAADPSASYVYAIYSDFSGPRACNTCPSPYMVVRTSADNGATFGAEVRVDSSPHVSWQYDPIIQVSNTGTVFAVWMNEYTIVFSKSTDHGAHWSAPLKVSGKISSDKPWFGISPSGADVYIAWAKGTGGDLYEAHSHDGGSTFSTAKMIGTQPNNHYYYPNGFAVVSAGAGGSAVLSASLYPGSSRQTSGLITITTFRTTNGGTAWTRSDVDTVASSVDFNTSSTTTLANDASGTTMVLEYSGATTAGGNGHIYVRRSIDGGASWSVARTELTPTIGGGNASFPAIDGGAAGVFRLTWMEQRAGSWNVYYRASSDGGLNWAAEADISDASGGASYKTAAGFASPYGDYDGVAITNTGKTVAISAQGASFGAGPGNVWVNREL